MAWTSSDMPDLGGRTALVTGATDGLGLQTALALAAKGARVVLAGRNPTKGEAALTRIRREISLAEVRFERAELGDLDEVRALAARRRDQPLDILVNNAGLMGGPRAEPAQGFERQLGVNYLSHFVLTGALLPALRAAGAARVVSLSSLAHNWGRIAFDDLQGRRSYNPMRAYGQSKLAMLLFAQELQRRSDRHGWGLTSLGAHPGFSSTNLTSTDRAADWMSRHVIAWMFQDARAGAAPQLLAATSPEVRGGAYWGPGGFQELKGSPAPARIARQGADAEVAARLWDVSQELTGFPFGEGA